VSLGDSARAIDGLPEDDKYQRAFMLFQVLELRLEIGDVEVARKIIEAIPREVENPSLESRRDMAVARLKTKEGDFAGALAVARSLSSSVHQGRLRGGEIALVAQSQAAAGDIAGALATVGSLEPDFSRAIALASIGLIQSRAGEATGAMRSFRQALQVAGSVPEVVNRNDGGDAGRHVLLRHIATVEAVAGQEADVSTWIAALASPNLRAWALVGLAEGLAQRRKVSKPVVGAAVPAPFFKLAPEGLDDLKAMQDHFRALARRLAPATVRLRRVGDNTSGSGVIVSKDGFVLSVFHVVGEADSALTAHLPDGRQFKANVVEVDRAADMALVKIAEGNAFPFVPMGRSNDVGQGQWCVALGFPGHAYPAPVFRVGRVIGQVAHPGKAGKKVIFTDCVTQGGDSGGPLFDLEGRVVGICSVIADLHVSTGNGHICIDHYRAAWERFIERGRRRDG
jgi:S1-C subfamily serine protease